MEHRLAAILHADVANDDHLTGDGEEGTLRSLTGFVDALDEAVAAHGRRLTNTADGAVLAEFASPVDALNCAVAAQRDLAAREPISPNAGKPQIRIGIEFDEIAVNGDGISGTGADVASRLQTLAEPGGICISGRVLGQVEYRVDVGFAYLGDHAFDGVDKQVKAFGVLLDPADAGTVTGVRGRGPVWPWLAAGLGLWLVVTGAVYLWWESW